MPYCTLNILKERLPEKVIIQLTDDDRLGVIDQTKVDGAISRADKEIDAWCGSRYQLPFVVVPAVIVELSADIAVYHLYARKAEKVPETRDADRKNAVRLLEQIAKGTVSLGVAEIPPAPESGGPVRPVVRASEKLFSDDKLVGF